jgi:hypothetical protein
MQQLKLGNSDLGEINFVGNMMTRATPQRVKIWKQVGEYFYGF